MYTKIILSDGTDVQANEGTRFLLVHLVLTNTSKKTARYGLGSFSVLDATGRMIDLNLLEQVNVEMWGYRTVPFADELRPRHSVDGQILFIVPEGIPQPRLVFEPNPGKRVVTNTAMAVLKL